MVESSQAGADRDGFTRWARGRQRQLLRAALLMTDDRVRAEDLVREALTQVALRWSRLPGSSSDACARKVIYHGNVSWWRRRRHEALTDQLIDLPAPGDLVDRAVVVRRALAVLTPRQRAVVVLRYFEDLTERDTAEILGVSVDTVASQTHLALRRLCEAAPELAELLPEEAR